MSTLGNVKGLDSRFKGPFLILSRPSRSTVEIKVGLNKDKSIRSEIRAWSDVKPAFLREDKEEAARPKRGRPKKPDPEESTPSDPKTKAKPAPTNSGPVYTKEMLDNSESFWKTTTSDGPPSSRLRSRSAVIAAVDFTKPPPNFKSSAGNPMENSTAAEPTICTGPPPVPGFPYKPKAWRASSEDLKVINKSIMGLLRPVPG